MRRTRPRVIVPLVAAVALMSASAATAVATTPSRGGGGAPISAAAGSATVQAVNLRAQQAQRRATLAVPGTVLGSTGWRVLSSATATQGGAAISKPGFDTGS